MIRRLSRSAIAHGLVGTGISPWIGRLSGAAAEPLILGYHRVLSDHAPFRDHGVPALGIRVTTLRRHLEILSGRYRFVTLDEMGERRASGSAQGLAAVTFDDGYADFADNAFPLLQSMGIPAAVFVVTRLLNDGAGFLHDRVYGAIDSAFRRSTAERVGILLAGNGYPVGRLPDDSFKATRALLKALDQETLSGISAVLEAEFGGGGEAPRSLSWDQLIRMSQAGLTVGSHTRTHVRLACEDAARVTEETAGSREELSARLGVPVNHFVYPDGCFDPVSVRAVAAAGYLYAYTGCHHRDREHPMLTLPRRVLWEGSTQGAFGRFSPNVLLAHVDGAFSRSGRCADSHGVPGRSSVAIVAPSLDVPGGQSIQAAALVEGLRHEGFEVLFVATNPRFPRGLGWLRRAPIARTLLNQALYALSLRRLRHADVVHVFSASFWSFLLAPGPAMLLGRALGKRVILNYHSGEAALHLEQGRGLVHPWLRLAHQIVVPSEHLRAVFERHGYEVRVVHNFIDTTRFGYRERTPLLPKLLSTRTLEPNYGVDVVVRAFALIQAEYPGATLTLAGSGSEEAALRQLAAGLEGVTFVGRVSPAQIPALCAAADLYLNASVVDNQPLSILEAFASGLPVVTTATGGIALMVRDGESGLIVPPSEAPAMARAVTVLLRDNALAERLALRGRAVAEQHSWDRVRDQWAGVYEDGRSQTEARC